MAGRVAFPAVQGIVATIGMALAFGYTVVCACCGSCASLKKLIFPVIIFRLESTIDGEIWHFTFNYTETAQSCSNKGGNWGERQNISLPIKFTGS